MDKELKKRALIFFTKCMSESLSSFKLYREKSKYFFGAETVWEDTSSARSGNMYVVFSPEYKGRNQFAIEIGWSKLRRFPHVSRRPFLAFEDDFKNCYELEEATTRLSYIVDEKEWLDIDMDNVEEVILKQMKNLIDSGLPFLLGIDNKLPVLDSE